MWSFSKYFIVCFAVLIGVAESRYCTSSDLDVFTKCVMAATREEACSSFIRLSTKNTEIGATACGCLDELADCRPDCQDEEGGVMFGRYDENNPESKKWYLNCTETLGCSDRQCRGEKREQGSAGVGLIVGLVAGVIYAVTFLIVCVCVMMKRRAEMANNAQSGRAATSSAAEAIVPASPYVNRYDNTPYTSVSYSYPPAAPGTGSELTLARKQSPHQSFTREESCVVCWDALRSTVFLPCQHRACCDACAKALRGGTEGGGLCPLCRAEIVQVKRDGRSKSGSQKKRRKQKTFVREQ